MPARMRVRMLPWTDKRRIAEGCVVARSEQSPPRDEFVDPLQLSMTERRLNVGEPVIEAECDLLVIPAAFRWTAHLRRIACHAVRPQQRHSLGELGIVGHRHSALA